MAGSPHIVIKSIGPQRVLPGQFLIWLVIAEQTGYIAKNLMNFQRQLKKTYTELIIMAAAVAQLIVHRTTKVNGQRC